MFLPFKCAPPSVSTHVTLNAYIQMELANVCGCLSPALTDCVTLLRLLPSLAANSGVITMVDSSLGVGAALPLRNIFIGYTGVQVGLFVTFCRENPTSIAESEMVTDLSRSFLLTGAFDRWLFGGRTGLTFGGYSRCRWLTELDIHFLFCGHNTWGQVFRLVLSSGGYIGHFLIILFLTKGCLHHIQKLCSGCSCKGHLHNSYHIPPQVKCSLLNVASNFELIASLKTEISVIESLQYKYFSLLSRQSDVTIKIKNEYTYSHHNPL